LHHGPEVGGVRVKKSRWSSPGGPVTPPDGLGDSALWAQLGRRGGGCDGCCLGNRRGSGGELGLLIEMVRNRARHGSMSDERRETEFGLVRKEEKCAMVCYLCCFQYLPTHLNILALHLGATCSSLL